MSKSWLKSIFLFLFLVIFFSLHLESQTRIFPLSDSANNLRNISPSFVENLGQFDDLVKYSLNFSGGQIFLTSQEIVFQSLGSADDGHGVVHNNRLRFLGSNPQKKIKGLHKTGAKINYLKGNDPKQWKRGAQTFESVLYKDIYPNIVEFLRFESFAFDISWRK